MNLYRYVWKLEIMLVAVVYLLEAFIQRSHMFSKIVLFFYH